MWCVDGETFKNGWRRMTRVVDPVAWDKSENKEREGTVTEEKEEEKEIGEEEESVGLLLGYVT